MLFSMTGYGEAQAQDPYHTVCVELRCVNNRHFKMSARLSDAVSSFENELERLIRDHVKRGTVQLSIRIDRPRRAEDYRLNLVALESYRDQFQQFLGAASGRSFDPAALLSLPGVVEESASTRDKVELQWSTLSAVVEQALASLQNARAEEGRVMAVELQALVTQMRKLLEGIAARVPHVVSSFHGRLTDRVRSLLQEQGVTIEPSDLVREVAIYADRSDVNEEITRLRAHFDQYEEILEASPSSGRKLEFVVQEMGREINTIGSKSSDVQISREVVELKGLLERIRELIQNVE